jgi:hypothetical protein
VSQGALAREFSVSPAAIGFIIRRKTWAHVPPPPPPPCRDPYHLAIPAEQMQL